MSAMKWDNMKTLTVWAYKNKMIQRKEYLDNSQLLCYSTSRNMHEVLSVINCQLLAK